MITQSELKSLLTYDEISGDFTWNKSNKLAGYIDKRGYVKIGIGNKSLSAHRLAFLYVTGEMPEFVDHANKIRSDNRWLNLRAATETENNRNGSERKSNTSGFMGVCWIAANRKWKAHVQVNGKQIHLGCFEDIELAALVASEGRSKYHGEFAA